MVPMATYGHELLLQKAMIPYNQLSVSPVLLPNLSQVCGFAYMCFLRDGHLVVCSILVLRRSGAKVSSVAD